MAEGCPEDKRPVFGNRRLEDTSRVLEHNAWDDVEWGEEQKRGAEEKVAENSHDLVAEGEREGYETAAAEYWDNFYQQHQNKFFKDRHWLFTEFPELSSDPRSGADRGRTVWEVGCGTGNTVFPLLQTNK
jgi:hypothetical protein